jgi:toxin FitB
MYLLDTNVPSEVRRGARADARVMAWVSSVNPAESWLSAITVLELEEGVLRLERRDAAQGAVLRRWLEQHVLLAFEGRILPVDVAVARTCARLHVPDRASYRDSLIGATALVHRMKLVTRNAKDFAGMGLEVINPWDAS